MNRVALALSALALAAIAAAFPPGARAQETQVSFDTAGRFFTVDLRLARRLGVFADSTLGFVEARLFHAGDSTYVLERTSMRDGRLVRERSPMSAREVEALRERFTALASERGGAALLDSDGRLPLVLGTAGLGLAYYGWAVPVALDAGGSSAGGLYLVTASASFFVPWAVTNGFTVSAGTSRLALYGATRGILHGLLLADLVSGPDVQGREALGWSVAASMAEGVLGYTLAYRGAMDEGTTAAIGVGGDFGMLIGVGVTAMADAWDDDNGTTASTLVLGGAIAGMTLGRAMAATHAYTAGDASVVRIAGGLGAWAGLALAEESDPDAESDATWGGALVIGSAAGLAVGDRLVTHRDFVRSAGMMVEYGTLAGSLMGMGLATLGSDEDGSGRGILWGGLAGGVAGFAATYASASRALPLRTGWNASLAPTGVLAVRADGRRAFVPALALTARF